MLNSISLIQIGNHNAYTCRNNVHVLAFSFIENSSENHRDIITEDQVDI